MIAIVWEFIVKDEARFNQMHRTSQQEYARLDILFAELTLSERQLGVFHWEA
jgi:hypothetical protein